MIETRRLKNVVISIQTILSFVLSRKINRKTKDFYGSAYPFEVPSQCKNLKLAKRL